MIDKIFKETGFDSEDFPSFPCPQCGSSLIVRDNEEPKTYESFGSREYYELEHDPEAMEGVFTLHLHCAKPSCDEAVCCIGRFTMTQKERHGNRYLSPILHPCFFYPAICVFHIPASVPEVIRKLLLISFSHFWNDPGAAGNCLRIAVESLLNHLHVVKTKPNSNGKRCAMDLHTRIETFKRNKPLLAHKLLAIKWIGNSASHLSGLDRNDLIHGYELFEYVMHETFLGHQRMLDRLATNINKHKGPAKLPKKCSHMRRFK